MWKIQVSSRMSPNFAFMLQMHVFYENRGGCGGGVCGGVEYLEHDWNKICPKLETQDLSIRMTALRQLYINMSKYFPHYSNLISI